MNLQTSLKNLTCRPFDSQKRYGHLWLEEAEQYEYTDGDDEVVLCAELAEELEWHEELADDDEDYGNELCEWTNYVFQHDLMLPLEQSCHEGVLLPADQRAIRLESCPETLLKPLRWFFELCPEHVKSRIALDWYLLIRMDRARRTGNPDWNPKTAQAKPEPHAFFTAPILKFRNYAR
ncbi:MAG: hypothetical protein MUF44_00675 [Hydrogenophaga sp.]|jgi:hypothetical protein|nr:hypothetical protein [Hydrogenophaga sp.]